MFEHRFGGLGLGLAISKSLAQAHGGTLTAQSNGSNRGSTFTLSMQALPQGEAASVASKTATDSTRQALKILLVDDHHDTCAALEKLLAGRGHLVVVSHDVRSAMEAAVRNKFDLLISDIALPDGTGMDLMMQLRAIANVPGIAISGFGNNGDIEQVYRPASPSISSNPSSSTISRPPSNGRSARRDTSVATSIAAWSSH